MGATFQVECKKCGCTFHADEGGGFVFHMLHCDACGKSKSVTFESLGELHLRYLKSFKGPYCIATREQDEYVQEHYEGEPLSEAEYHAQIEEKQKPCKCGGRFTFKAIARCPQCRSTDYEGPVVAMYD